MTEKVRKAYWTQGYRSKIKPDIAYRELEKIREKNGGRMVVSLIVNAARSKRNPLHPVFEWDDSVAAEEFRQEQARRMSRSLKVVYEGAPELPPTRAFLTITEEAKKGAPERKVYVSTAEALQDPVMRDEILGNAIRDAISYRRKYAALSELGEVFVAIDHFIEAVGHE